MKKNCSAFEFSCFECCWLVGCLKTSNKQKNPLAVFKTSTTRLVGLHRRIKTLVLHQDLRQQKSGLISLVKDILMAKRLCPSVISKSVHLQNQDLKHYL